MTLYKYSLLKELEGKATKGEWYVSKWKGLSTDGPMIMARELKTIAGAKNTGIFIAQSSEVETQQWENSRLVAEARNQLPHLLRDLEIAVEALKLISSIGPPYEIQWDPKSSAGKIANAIRAGKTMGAEVAQEALNKIQEEEK